MRHPYRPSRSFLLALLPLLALALILATVSRGIAQGTGRKPVRPRPTPAGRKGVVAMATGDAAWKEVDRLVSEQKLEEASKRVAAIRTKARAAGDEAEWTKALIREVQLRTALHGFETSVRFLKEEPWPAGFLPHATLELFYGQSLVTYERAYSWEVGKREKVESKNAVDLKAWTKEEIRTEAAKAYVEVWNARERLGGEPVSRLADYLDANDYPNGVRGTLRDAVSYLFAELLGDTSGWRPEQSNELFTLDLGSLVAGGPAVSRLVKLADPAVHPLLKVGAILDDLEAWHAANGEREAALEARLARLRQLQASFSEGPDRTVIRKDLERRLPAFRDVSWWAAGMAQLAEFVRDAGERGNLVRARAIAEEGRKAYPESIGGQRGLHIVKAIEAPDYQLAAMTNDGAGKRSIQVTHKNLPRVWFRAYPVDLRNRIETVTDYNLLPAGEELRKLVRGGTPAAEWSVDLPKTPDFKPHRTFVTPPMRTPGFYVVAASARSDFGVGSNRILAVDVLVSDLVLVSRPDDAGGVEAQVLSGDTGKPVAEARVTLYRFDWQKGHHQVESKTTDASGTTVFAYQGGRSGGTHFLLVAKGTDLALDANYIAFYRTSEPSETTGSLVYSDRSIYRPLQKVFWKVVAYRGRSDQARFQTLPETAVTVSLVDPNNQKVDSKLVKTNTFGSAAGEFTIPTGRILGGWRLESSLSGQTPLRVEEYKRPTFEAAFKDPKSPLRLNRPATLTAEVKYYFGLPVVNGSVRWRVTREPVYPWWWGWWYFRSGPTGSQTVASGTSALKEDGSFDVTFTPRADERKAKEKGVTYRYQVSADVTDEGGETRSASRSFRLGFVSVEARVQQDEAFFREGVPAGTTLVRTDLDGIPRAGKGTWRLLRIQQPSETRLPADEPATEGSAPAAEEDAGAEGGAKFQTPGDRLRPRWQAADPWERTLHGWPEGAEERRGAVTHDEKGEAKVALGTLDAGAYRLKYETVDDFGATFQMTKDFVVAGRKTPLALPALLLAESSSVPAGGTARLLVVSGLSNQVLFLDITRAGKLVERRRLASGKDAQLIEIPVAEKDRGGFGASLSTLRDHQFLQQTQSVFVPWDDRELKVEFATFRDKVRPGAKESWRVTVKGPKGGPEAGTAELLAYMYDKSLDLFGPHNPPSSLSLYPNRSGAGGRRASLGQASGQWVDSNDFPSVPGYPGLSGDRLKFFDGYGIGGPGQRGMMGGALGHSAVMRSAAAPPMVAESKAMAQSEAYDAAAPMKKEARRDEADKSNLAPAPLPEAPVALRSDFSETAFWRPSLLTERDGSAAIEFTVPDSVTAWNVWVHAVTKDLRSGSLHKETKSVKDLMVRPYVPRFLREGDSAEIKVVVNNASEKELAGSLLFDILDPETNASLLSEFGLTGGIRPFSVKAGGGTNLTFAVRAPKRVGLVAFKVTARSGDTSDGELRPVPLLPSRVHLAQSRFVTLRNKDQKTLRFDDLANESDPTRINEQMVVTVDAQLFYTVLQALPYLVNYPYECTEQTLNRFVSTGIVSSLYRDYPAIGRMAQEMSRRDVPLETWDAADPNRKMALEESPWLETARGGKDAGAGLTNVLDPRVARADRDASLAKLRKAQTSNGAFPWWPGGPPSPYMTLYILHGFAKATEFGVDVPKDMVQRGWAYLATHFREDLRSMMARDCCWEFLTFLNYVASCYPDSSWTGDALTPAERNEILDFSFKHWKQHSPFLKGYLTLTLKRAGRAKDAQLVWDSVMDSAKTNEEQGTFWAAEDRSWLWYNDTIETHAFALRTVMELNPKDARRDGLVQWILINKKLNQWKSTRATAEVIYSLIHYLKQEGALGIREDATVTVGSQKVTFIFEPDKYTGKKNQIVISGEKIDPKTTSTIVVEKESKGFAFASATWHFSTDTLPAEDRGDFFAVSRRYFKREQTGREFVLKPLAEGAALKPGDEVEVQLSLRTRHEAEYVHLRDPRAAGLEPENAVSRYKWDLGIGWYEETRDSGTNFFFERLPVGEYTFKYRLRANMAGTFRVGPATVQSMYAPEFNAYSAGNVMTIAGEK